MKEVLIALLSGAGGTAIGCVISWILMTHWERNKARREALLKAAEALADYGVAYAQWYVEYLSPLAQSVRGHWARPPVGSPDPLHLRLMSDVDKGRGRIKVIVGSLWALFPEKVIDPVCSEMMKVVIMSSQGAQADCRDVDCVVERACGIIPDLIRRYSCGPLMRWRRRLSTWCTRAKR